MKWLPLSAPQDQYAVSDEGYVMNAKTGHILRPSDDRRGYARVDLHGKHRKVHRLVAERFLPAPTQEGLVIDHIDRNRLNNHASNLRWVTIKENNRNSGICQKCYIASLVAW
jgi:hypothetical protein